MIVLDTHVLLWWALDPEMLSERARELTGEMERHGGFASAISVWELGIKVKRGKLELPITVDDFAARIARGNVVELVPVDTEIWLRSLALGWDHDDPADRVIVATAAVCSLPLLTKDRAIREFNGCDTVW